MVPPRQGACLLWTETKRSSSKRFRRNKASNSNDIVFITQNIVSARCNVSCTQVWTAQWFSTRTIQRNLGKATTKTFTFTHGFKAQCLRAVGGNLFTITGRMNRILSLAPGGPLNQLILS